MSVSMGYQFTPSRYSPPIGYSQLIARITAQPTGRLADVKNLIVPAIVEGFYRQTHISRHGEIPIPFKVCLGRIEIQTHDGIIIHAFTFGGEIKASVNESDRICTLVSTAPILKLRDDEDTAASLIADEMIDSIAEALAKSGKDEEAFFYQLSMSDPYHLFLAGLISMQNRLQAIPVGARRERDHQAVALVQKTIDTVKRNDGWDGSSPALENYF